jgi:uncharacterized protein (DUF58 family)
MLYPKDSEINKLNFSIYSAAALIQLMLQQRDGIGLSLCSDKIEKHLPAKLNHSHIQYIFAILSDLMKHSDTLNKKTDISDALHQIAEVVNQRSLIIIFSDIFENSDNIFPALQHLRHRKHDVIIFHTLDYSTEVNFDFDNRPYLFVDLETGEQVKLNSLEIKNDVHLSMKTFLENVRENCHRYKIDFVPVDIKHKYNEVLQEYLIKRSRILKK